VADHPLRPATDRRLGKPLPHQLANRTSAAPIAGGPCRSPPFLRRAYAVLAPVSRRYPPLRGTFRCVTHPFAARRQGCPRAAARLACVKHAASVQSEPGSNSSVRSLQVTQSTLAPSPALASQEQDSRPHPVPQARTPFASREHQNFWKYPPSFHPPCRRQHSTLPPRHPSAPAPTLIGCILLKNWPPGHIAQETPAKRRDYTSKRRSVNNFGRDARSLRRQTTCGTAL
jgi:hypothetical protein